MSVFKTVMAVMNHHNPDLGGTPIELITIITIIFGSVMIFSAAYSFMTRDKNDN